MKLMLPRTAFLLITLCFLFHSCQKEGSVDNGVPVLPVVGTTTAASSITSTTVVSGGTVTAQGGSPVTARGVCWSTSPNPVITGSHTTDGSGVGSFTSMVTGLNSGTTYYLRSYSTNSSGTTYGSQISFTTPTTPGLVPPTLTTTIITAITQTTAVSGGNISSDGGDPVTARGVCWSTAPGPVVTGDHTTNGTGTGTFTSNLSGLPPNTLFYLRAYASNSAGTAYGNELVFQTAVGTQVLATLITLPITSITATGGMSGGNITSDGGSYVTERGLCWNTTGNPVYTGSHTINGTGTGSYPAPLSALSPNTTYFVRAYALTAYGIAYGNQLSFTTLPSSSNVDVYVGGYDRSGGGVKRATLWKNGVPSYLPDVLFGVGYTDAEVNSVFVAGSDVYAVGWEMSPVNPNKLAMLWKNGVPTILSDQSRRAEAKQVFVSGTDVYVLGWEDPGSGAVTRVWKNGVGSTPPLNFPATGGSANSIFVSGADVYYGGAVDNGTNNFSIPRTWENGAATTLTNIFSSTVMSIFVDGADVHAAGFSYDGGGSNTKLCYWKNGARTILSDIDPWDVDQRVLVSGGNVYVSGNSYSGTRAIANYWKNGAITQLASGSDSYYSKGIFVHGTDVYVAGQKASAPVAVAKVWKNGVETSLSINDASANCVYVK